MKRTFLIFAAAACLWVPAHAQGGVKYADLSVYCPGFKNYVAELRIDSNASTGKSLLRDATGRKIKFASEVDALNYVTRQGWELVSSYHSHGGQTHFVLKR